MIQPLTELPDAFNEQQEEINKRKEEMETIMADSTHDSVYCKKHEEPYTKQRPQNQL